MRISRVSPVSSFLKPYAYKINIKIGHTRGTRGIHSNFVSGDLRPHSRVTTQVHNAQVRPTARPAQRVMLWPHTLAPRMSTSTAPCNSPRSLAPQELFLHVRPQGSAAWRRRVSFFLLCRTAERPRPAHVDGDGSIRLAFANPRATALSRPKLRDASNSSNPLLNSV